MSNNKASHGTGKIAKIIGTLEREYGLPAPRRGLKEDPIEELVRTILSQNTNDINRDRALEGLKRRFSSWEEAANARASSVEAAIRVGGLARQKSRHIQAALKWAKKSFGDYSLEALRDMPSGKVYEMLTALDGVGPKTAAIVLLFSLGRPYFPVDTHIHRVTTRLGLLPEKTDAGKAHAILADTVPREKYYSAHLNIISHGRKVCSARNPGCSGCALLKICPWPAKHPGEHK